MMDIRHTDALSLLGSLSDRSVDLIITDPPYEFRSTKGGGAFGSAHREYHDELTPLSHGVAEEELDAMMRVMRVPNIYIWCNQAQVPQYLDYFVKERGCAFDILTWHKTNPTPLCSNKYLSDTEYCLFFRKGAKVYGSYATKAKYWVTPNNVADKKAHGHPTVKPLSIIRTLVENSSVPGDLICDPFMGSGTTAVACKDLGRRFVGCDIDEGYVHTAKKRTGRRASTLFPTEDTNIETTYNGLQEE